MFFFCSNFKKKVQCIKIPKKCWVLWTKPNLIFWSPLHNKCANFSIKFYLWWGADVWHFMFRRHYSRSVQIQHFLKFFISKKVSRAFLKLKHTQFMKFFSKIFKTIISLTNHISQSIKIMSQLYWKQNLKMYISLNSHEIFFIFRHFSMSNPL